MEKTAITQYPITDFNASRWSPRSFSQEKVTREMLGSLFEAARWAPSCFNEQPWRFIVGNDGDDTWQKLKSCLVEGNMWAANAPVLMLSVASLNFERNGNANRFAAHDVGLAVGALTAQATCMGLVLHQMGGYDANKAREILNIPQDYEPMAAIALGFPSNPEELPEDLREKEKGARSRKPLTNMAFSGEWGKSLFQD